MNNPEDVVESIEPENPALWNLFIKQLSDNRLRIEDVNPDGTVLDFKIKVGEVLSLNVDRQRMIFRGKVLENAKKLKEYGITDNSCVHLLKRAENRPESQLNNELRTPRLSRTSNIVEQPSNAQAWNFDTGDLSRIINQQLRRTTGGNSRRLGRPFAIGDNVEHIYQGLATLETLENHFDQRRSRMRNRQTLENQQIEPDTHDILHCLDDDEIVSRESDVQLEEFLEDDFVEEKVNSVSGVNAFFEQVQESEENQEIRHFQVGQWIDCLDTVNQWLEATITHISEDKRKIRVHYNGWGTRWDETIDVTSPRIARFRTKSKNKAQCRNFSPTLNHWVSHTPQLNDSNDLTRLAQTVSKASEPVLAQLRRVTNDEYGECATFEEAQDLKRQDIIELAPKLDILGRAIADLGRSFANRPNFKRRQDYLRQPCSLLQLVRVPLIPFGMKTSMERDRKVNGQWNDKEHEELIRNLEYDEQLVKLSHGPNNVHQRSRNSRNVELHLHAIVASSELRLPSNTRTTVSEDNETQTERVEQAGEAIQNMLDSIAEDNGDQDDSEQDGVEF